MSKFTISVLYKSLYFFALIIVSYTPISHGQTIVTGHYVPLFASGLKSGILPTHPGFIYQNGTLFYHTSTFKDNNGNKVKGVDEVNIWANRNGLLWITGKKIFRADYGNAIAIPITNLAPNPVVIQGETLSTGFGIGDIAVAPVVMGWHWTNYHVQTGYTLFIPTGKFKLNATDNTGKGFWTNMFHLAGTWMPAGPRPWHASLMTRLEIHSNQKDRDLRPGSTLTLEAGLGKKITDTIDAGIIGHSWSQITDTTGSDAEGNFKYRSFGIGGEIQYIIAKKFPSKLRFGTDFAARNVSQGQFLVIEFNIPIYNL